MNISYDSQYCILYIRDPNGGHSYGEEHDGYVIYRSIGTDAITGIAISTERSERKMRMLNYREVEEKVKKLEEENRELKNRCYATTLGTFCQYCKLECRGRFGELNRNEQANSTY